MTRPTPADRAETMRSIRTFAQVFQYLVDHLGWPLDIDDCLEDDDLAAVTYDWDPVELGVPAQQLESLRLNRLRQMRPLTASQPWGVFFLEFSGPRLRYTLIRRLLRALVARKRAPGAAAAPTWALSDLLFVVITGSGESLEVHLLAFDGRDHTWGERFAPEPGARLPAGRAVEVRPVAGMPEQFDYDPESEALAVGAGVFAPVSPQAWDFEVSGLRVLRSWLGYRMRTRKGRKSSPLDDIRPTRWTQTKELLLVLSIIEHTVEATPKAAALLDEIVQGPLIPAADLSTPTPANRKPPRV